MAGFEIVDTYKAYKVRERKVTAWLKATASRFGFRSSSSSPSGGGASKTAAAAHEIPIREIPAAVRLIVSHGEAIPEDLRQLLRDVIAQRKEARGYYKAHPGRSEDKSGLRHAHYLGVLEEALRAFEGRQRGPGVADPDPGPLKGEAAPGHSRSDVEFNNLFDLLGLDDVAGNGMTSTEEAALSNDERSDDGETPESQSGSAKKPKKAKSGKKKGKAKKPKKTETAAVQRSTPTNAEIEMVSSITARDRELDAEDEEDELYFMIYCFFKDFNYMREYVQERWCDYQDGILSLAAVGITTNTAFELLQRSERQLLSQIPLRSGLRSFQAMADLLFFERGLQHVDYDEKQAIFEGDRVGMKESIFEEADFICLPMYWHISEWLRMAPPRKIPVLVPFLGTTPDYQAQSGDEKMERNRQVLHEMLAECCIIKEFKNNPQHFMIPGEDELTIGWTTMLATRKLPIWLIFASQIFCDIRAILETDVSKCQTQLYRMGQRVDSTLKKYIDFANDFAVEPHKLFTTTIGEVECWITRDFLDPRRSQIYQSHRIAPDLVEKHAYQRRNPVLCGVQIFRFSLTMNELGVQNSNQWGSIIASAHLYNAARHEVPSFPQWLDIEALIVIHTPQRIFWRENLPETPEQYALVFERATGVGEMVAQRKQGIVGTLKPSKVEQRGMAPIRGVSHEFWERLCFGRPDGDRLYTLPAIEKVLNGIAENEMHSVLEGLRLLGSSTEQPSLPSKSSPPRLVQETSIAVRSTPAAEHFNSALTQQFQRTHALTNVQLLDVLCMRVSQESYALNFDYFALHQRCTLLLKAVYEEFKIEIMERDDELDWTCGEMPVVLHWLFEMLQDEQLRSGVLERLKGVMGNMVREEGDHEVARVRQFVNGGMDGGEDGMALTDRAG